MTRTVSQSKRMSMVVHGNGSANKAAALTSSHGGVFPSRMSNTEAASAGGLASQSTGPPSPTKLRGVTEMELRVWKKATQQPISMDYSFIDLNEAIDYAFRNNDSVWILSGDDNWYLGRVAGKNIRVGQTRQSKQGFYYPVCYGKRMNLRRYCSPLNGDMKPNTKDFRDLLRRHGLLDDDEDEEMSDSTDSGSSYSDSF